MAAIQDLVSHDALRTTQESETLDACIVQSSRFKFGFPKL